MKKILICIVAYDAQSTLKKVLDRIPLEVRQKVAEVVVFDDESKDGTFKVAKDYQISHPDFQNLFIYRNSHNLGYGGNQKRGYLYCIKKGYDIAVLLHGDGQYAPEALPELLKPLEEGRADAVFGSRMMSPGAALKGGMPLYKYIGNKILTFFENRLLGMDLTEFHSGYRLYSVSALKDIPFERNTNDFHFDTEIIVQLNAKKKRIVEIPIPTYYGDEICHVNGIKYAFQVAISVLEYRLHTLGIIHYPKYAVNSSPYRFKQDPHSSHGQVARLIPESGNRILDVGSGPSELSSLLKKRGNRIVGVDRHFSKEGHDGLEQRIEKDLEKDFDLPFGREFDTVLFLDVLEHLKEPAMILGQARKYLKPGGKVIISIPNVAHWSVRFSLLLGSFQYGERGILDKTHLHFYTLKSFRQMLRENNYSVVHESATPLPLLDSFPVIGLPCFRWIHWTDVILTRLWKTLFGYQFIFVVEDTFDEEYVKGR